MREKGSIFLDNMRQELDHAHSQLKEAICQNRYAGMQAACDLCAITDHILNRVFDRHFNLELRNQIAIIAIGGYGRGVLAPYSDLDLCFIVENMNPELDQAIREFLYDLWYLKFKLGYAIGTISEITVKCSDMQRRTALLERRFLIGNYAFYETLSYAYMALQESGKSGFIQAKLNERDRRHQKSGASRYLVEPNLKEGIGGLRDIHTMMWIGKYISQTQNAYDLVTYGAFTLKDWQLIQKSERLFWAIRFLLHLEVGYACETIHFDIQPRLTELLGYRNSGGLSAIERFMRHYFLAARQIGTLGNHFSLALEIYQDTTPKPFLTQIQSPAFELKNNRLNFKPHITLRKNPEQAFMLFKIADQYQIDIHPNASNAIYLNLQYFNDDFRTQPESYKIFREILCRGKSPEKTLRQMSDVGILGKLIPDFAKITCLMQFNMYHHYTVDEHLIRCVGVMHDIANGNLKREHPLSSDLIHKLNMLDVLFLAIFIHDMAKGRPEDHSEEGAKIISWLAPKMGFNHTEIETAKWLTLHHLHMSDIAQKRDLSDPIVHKEFADFVQSSERLKLLLCLTVADIRGVGPGVWNGYKGALLRTLYTHTQEILLGGYTNHNRHTRVEYQKQNFINYLQYNNHAMPSTRILDGLANRFWLSTTLQVQQCCINLISQDLNPQEARILMTADKFTDSSEIIIYTKDYAGLFTSNSGALAVSRVGIYDAQLFICHNGYALNIFKVKNIDGHAITEKMQIKRIQKKITQMINQKNTDFSQAKQKNHNQTLKKYQAVYTDISNITIDNHSSNSASIIEITAMNRHYLLYDIARTLYDLNISVTSAHINTYGEKAIDVFYIKDKFGHKIISGSFIKKIKKQILQAVC